MVWLSRQPEEVKAVLARLDMKPRAGVNSRIDDGGKAAAEDEALSDAFILLVDAIRCRLHGEDETGSGTIRLQLGKRLSPGPVQLYGSDRGDGTCKTLPLPPEPSVVGIISEAALPRDNVGAPLNYIAWVAEVRQDPGYDLFIGRDPEDPEDHPEEKHYSDDKYYEDVKKGERTVTRMLDHQVRPSVIFVPLRGR